MRGWPPAAALLGIGWYIAACIVLGLLAGLWLDDQAGISPALTIAGLALGLAAAGWGGYRMLLDVLAGRLERRPSQRCRDDEGRDE